jgi:WD40 repeat protein
VSQTLVCTTSKRTLTLGKKLATSGEGVVWETSLPGYLAKLYHTPTPERIEKLQAMIADPPEDPTLKLKHISIAWPQELLQNQRGDSLGFLMPAILQGEKLSTIYNPRLRNRKAPQFNWYYLHTTALNVASIIENIHAKGYVVGDIKPQNFLVNRQALPSIIDTDSFQIRDPHSEKVYRCLVGSEGFTPAELLGKDLGSLDQTATHDLFRLGVLIYLLLFGDHPFKGKWIGPGDAPNPTELIRRGYWPYGPGSLIQPGPTTIPVNAVHPTLEGYFRRCFTDGHANPAARPTAAEWCRALRVAIPALKHCDRQTNHYYSGFYGQCYWCERRSKLGLDIFDTRTLLPSKAASPARTLPNGVSWSTASKPVSRRKALDFRYRPEFIAGVSFLLASVCFGLLAASQSQSWRLFNASEPVFPVNASLEESGERRSGASADLGTLPGTEDLIGITSLAISPDGQTLVSGGRDLSVKLWNIETRKLLVTLTGHSSTVNSIAISAGGQELLSTGEDGRVVIWRLPSGETVRNRIPKENTTTLEPMAISPKGQLVVSSSTENQILLRSLGTGKVLHTLNDYLVSGQSLAISPDGRWLASNGADGGIKLWNLQAGTLVRNLAIDQDWQNYDLTRAIAISSNAKHLATGGTSGQITLRDPLTGQPTQKLAGHEGVISALVFSPDGRLLASAGEDHTIKVWNVDTGEQLYALP